MLEHSWKQMGYASIGFLIFTSLQLLLFSIFAFCNPDLYRAKKRHHKAVEMHELQNINHDRGSDEEKNLPAEYFQPEKFDAFLTYFKLIFWMALLKFICLSLVNFTYFTECYPLLMFPQRVAWSISLCLFGLVLLSEIMVNYMGTG